MADAQEDFFSKVIAAVEEKSAWYDSTELPKVQENYRTHLTYVKNLGDALVKKSLIQDDPYKKDKKISAIVAPENTEFTENERALTLGIRYSDYESMIDFICNYMKFSVEQINMDRIRRLMELNSTFNWSNLSAASAKPNTKALGIVVNELRNGAPQITLSLIKDATFKSTQALNEINESLKKLADFQKERYKVEVRKNVIMNPQFNRSMAYNSAGTMITEIKRLFPTCMPKRPFAADLIAELAAEEAGPDRAAKQSQLLQKLQVAEKKNVKKENTVNTHDILADAVRTIGTCSEQYGIVLTKIISNHDVLESERNTLKDKIGRFFRKTFGIAEPPVDYDIIITDAKTQGKRKEKIHYTEFTQSLSKRIKYYGSFANRNTQGYARMAEQDDKSLQDFFSRQFTDNNRLLAYLAALDDYFKNAAQPANRGKIKGIKMELSTLKSILIKANQIYADYMGYIEEQEQMKKLGIVDNA
ncbi:MAG: hypothetical protein J1F14_00180 [Treponema sp.]|nr:hypothetical protein [Treponema sp.]